MGIFRGRNRGREIIAELGEVRMTFRAARIEPSGSTPYPTADLYARERGVTLGHRDKVVYIHGMWHELKAFCSPVDLYGVAGIGMIISFPGTVSARLAFLPVGAITAVQLGMGSLDDVARDAAAELESARQWYALLTANGVPISGSQP